jgi:peptidoglycan-associated lipoprotein
MLRRFVLAPALAVAACGGAKPPEVTAPAPSARAETPAATTTQTTVAAKGADNAQNTGTIQISDEIRKKCGISDSEAYFAFDSSRLRSTDLAPLDKVAVCFTRGPLSGRGIRLVGHADPRGPADYNMMLGHARADSVGHYLDDRGMERSKTETTSRGAQDATGVDESGWAKDRRVDVLLGQ